MEMQTILVALSKPAGHHCGSASITLEVRSGDLRGDVDLDVSVEDVERLCRMQAAIYKADQDLNRVEDLCCSAGPPPTTVLREDGE